MHNKDNSQLEHLQKYFPKKVSTDLIASNNKPIENKQNINNNEDLELNNFKNIEFEFENIYTFISSNAEIEGNYFTLNLMALDSNLSNKKNLIINLDSTYKLMNFYRGLSLENIYNTEIPGLFISNNKFEEKKKLVEYIRRINKLEKFDNIIIIMNLERDFMDIFNISNHNFILTNINSKSIVKIDKILKVLSQYKKINFGLFLIDINQQLESTKTNIKFITKNFIPIHSNLFLIGISFQYNIIETSKKRKHIAFKDFNLINESYIFNEYKKIYFNYKNFIMEKKKWIQKQKIKIK